MKSIPKFAVDNHYLTLMVILGLVLYGFFAILKMPKAENPAIQPPGVSIIILYPGASPSDMEELVTEPLEKAINGLTELLTISSVSGNSYAAIAVEFELSSDVAEKFREVTEKINAIRPELPPELGGIEVIRWSVDDVNIIELALVSETASYRELHDHLEILKDDITKVEGIRETEIFACPEREVRVSVDLEKMATMKIPLDRIIGVIQASNANIPGGKVDIGRKSYNIKTSGSFETIDDLKNTVIPLDGGEIVYLHDIAEVEFRDEESGHEARFNGKKAILLTANQKSGTNIFHIKRRLDKVISDFESKLPSNMKLHYAFDQGQGVRRFILGFFLNLLEGVLLVGFITWIGIGNRPSAVAMISIPASIVIAMGFVDLAGFGIQQVQVAGLVVALGLIVDNAIVVTQNINRFIANGHSPKAAAVDATVQVGPSIASGTITTCLAFLPIILMSNISGDFIRSMPITVIFTLLASLFCAMTLVPYLASKWFKPESARKRGVVQKALYSFIETRYRIIITTVLRRPWATLGIALLLFLATLPLIYVMGTSLFPKADVSLIFVNVTLPDGSSREGTEDAIAYVENILAEKDYIDHYVANIGGHNPRIYYNAFPKQARANIGQVFVEIEMRHSRRIPEIVAELRADLADYPGARIDVKELEQGHPNEAAVAIQVIGKNMDELKRISGDVEAMFRSTPGVVNIENSMSGARTDIKININREKAGMLGITPFDIDKAIRVSMAGIKASTFRDAEGRQYDIIVRLPVTGTARIEDFDRIYITNPLGNQFPLAHLATIEYTSSPLLIDHYDLGRSNTVLSDVETGFNVNRVTSSVIEKLDRYDWPDGYYYHISGQREEQTRAFGGLGRSFAIMIIAIFAVLVYQFKSIRQPIIIFSAIPLAIIGSLIALFLSGNDLSFTAMVGLASLAGIVINNAIILVDFANTRRAEGASVTEALISAGEVRFVPIILTAATTIGGLLPLTLFGGYMWNPMGWAIIGGLLTSTALTLLVVPVLYKLLAKENSIVSVNA